MANICINMTVNWQGSSIKYIDKLVVFRNQIEQVLGIEIPFTHFINPRYWLFEKTEINSVLYKVYRPGLDEISLQVNCWHDLVKAAGVKPILGHSLSRQDNGYSTPLGVYSAKSINDIIAFSKTLLQESLQNIAIAGFRCGCWLSSDKVLTALMHNHFQYDSSAIPPMIFSQGYSLTDFGSGVNQRGYVSPAGGYARFYQLINQLWGYHETTAPSECGNQLIKLWNPHSAITATSQPFQITQGKYRITQRPNNGGIADFVNSQYLINTFKALQCKTKKTAVQMLNVGCQQETAGQALISLLPLFDYVKNKKKLGARLKLLTVSKSNEIDDQ